MTPLIVFLAGLTVTMGVVFLVLLCPQPTHRSLKAITDELRSHGS